MKCRENLSGIEENLLKLNQIEKNDLMFIQFDSTFLNSTQISAKCHPFFSKNRFRVKTMKNSKLKMQ